MPSSSSSTPSFSNPSSNPGPATSSFPFRVTLRGQLSFQLKCASFNYKCVIPKGSLLKFSGELGTPFILKYEDKTTPTRVHVMVGNLTGPPAIEVVGRDLKGLLGNDIRISKTSDFYSMFELKIVPERLEKQALDEFQRKWPYVRVLVDEERTLTPIKIHGFAVLTITEQEILETLQDQVDLKKTYVPFSISFLVTKNKSRMFVIVFGNYHEAIHFYNSIKGVSIREHKLEFKLDLESLSFAPNLVQISGLPRLRDVDLDAILQDIHVLPIEAHIRFRKDSSVEFIICEVKPADMEFLSNTILAVYNSAKILPISPEFDLTGKKPLPVENVSLYEAAIQENTRKMSKLIATTEEILAGKSGYMKTTNKLAIDTATQVDSLQVILMKYVKIIKTLQETVDILQTKVATLLDEQHEHPAKRHKSS